MMFFTGFSRTASEIATEQINNTSQKTSELSAMKDMVKEAVNILNNHCERIERFGELLDESWKLKKSLSSKTTTSVIDDMYDAAIKAGAIGGKLCGAGGGGFMLLFVPPRKQRAVKEALINLLHVPFNFETVGSQITLYSNNDH
jgi:D-glycero-alpha-D-manno-heptose-7-phosphate kinase